MTKMTKEQLLELARKGAELRLKQLRNEIRVILNTFKDIEIDSAVIKEPQTGRPVFLVVNEPKKKLSKTAEKMKARWSKKTKRPKKHKMSAAGRKAIQEAQKKRWAKKRGEIK